MPAQKKYNDIIPLVIVSGLITHQAARKHPKMLGQSNISLLIAFKILERTRNTVTAKELVKLLPFINSKRISQLKKELKTKHGYLTNPRYEDWKLTPAGNVFATQLIENLKELSQQAGELYALFEDM